jgi:hypothetical protein
MLGVVLASPGEATARALTLILGAATVKVEAAAYSPVMEERARIDLQQRSRAAEAVSDLLPLLSPGAAAALARMEPSTLQAAGTVWLAACIGADGVTGWQGVLTPEGAPVPLTADAWQLACFTIPGFARAFLHAWLEPSMVEETAGNA